MLFGSAVLEVIIGLVFLYLLLSLICSALNEWIAGLLALRSKTLRDGIENMLVDPYAQGLAERFFDNPLITGLARKGSGSFPSYIDARTFTMALLDSVVPTRAGTEPRDPLATYGAFYDKLVILSESGSDVAKTLLTFIRQAGGQPQMIGQVALELQQLQQARQQLAESMEMLPEGALRTEAVKEILDQLNRLDESIAQAETEARRNGRPTSVQH